MDLELQGSFGENSEVFITCFQRMLRRSHDDQRIGFLEYRISLALEVGKTACVVGTLSDRDAFEKMHYL